MEDVNKRLCELLDCEPYETYSRLTGLYIEDYPDFADPSGRIDLLKRMRKRDDHEEFASFINPNHLWDTYLIDLLLDDTGALARAALDFLEGKNGKEKKDGTAKNYGSGCGGFEGHLGQ